MLGDPGGPTLIYYIHMYNIIRAKHPKTLKIQAHHTNIFSYGCNI